MDKKEKNTPKKVLKGVCILVVMAFITLYISQVSGYYEYEQYKKVSFTNEQIEKFEKDVASGKNVQIEDYLEGQNKDYDNKISKIGYSLSKGISSGIKSGIEGFFKVLNKVVEE